MIDILGEQINRDRFPDKVKIVSNKTLHIHCLGMSEYYLFNSFNQMKGYSDGEKYAYYGYDDKGERTYKMGFYTTISN
ncbi:MAG: hypothetical protein LBI60_05610, partial [Bacteroidales bacterium]|nr:hypothetical protein [Bacteroidales bacterium]